MKIVLASKSPRRHELLKNMGLEYTVMVSNEKEEFNKDDTPKEIVCQIALAKAKNVAKCCDNNDIVIGADTVVVLDGEIYGKPKDEKDAVDMLMKLSGIWHSVYTGVAVIQGDKTVNEAVCTKVLFTDFDKNTATRYVATGEPMDKAGAYGIQEKGSMLVEKIDGDYFNVMGLPVCRLSQILKDNFNVICL